MKVYIIYKNDKFVGYTESKDVLDKFLKLRGKKYTYEKIDKSDIDSKILASNTFEQYELVYYQGYRLVNELPVFYYELLKIDENLNNMLTLTYKNIRNLLHDIDYIRIKKRERDTIKGSILYIQNQIKYHIDTDEPVYDENIDIVKFLDYISSL